MKVLLKCAFALLFLTNMVSAGTLLNEGFDNIAALPGSGWALINNSNTIGTTGWFQGNTGIFDAHSGATDSYIAANFNNAAFGGNISNWLISPEMTFGPSNVLTFWTRGAGEGFADRLEVRLSPFAGSTNVGSTDSSVGDFNILMLTINPALDGFGYPSDWTQMTVTFGSGSSFDGRFAFRYDVPDTSVNADYIGIDSVSLTTAAPEPISLVLLGSGLLGLVGMCRRNRH